MDKKTLVLLSLVIVSTLLACTKEEFPTKEHDVRQDSQKEYLSFPSKEDFGRYVKALGEGTNALRATQIYATHVPKGFKSIAQLKEEQSRLKASSYSSGLRSSAGNLEEETEMTQDEFNLFRSEELLADGSLSLALDTTMRVQIGDELYVVTEVGTFSAPVGKEEELEKAINDVMHFSVSSNFIEPVIPLPSDIMDNASQWRRDNSSRHQEISTKLADANPAGEIDLGSSVKFLNTYAAPKEVPQIPGTIEDPSQSSGMPEYHRDYNVVTYEWKEDTWLGKALGTILGSHNIGKEQNFDSKNRIQLYVYDLNFGFIQVVGIKARKQRRKSFLFVKYWVPTTSEKMVLGFNHLYAEAKEKITSGVGAGIMHPTAENTIGGFQEVVNGEISDFITRSYRNVDFISDWSHEIAALVPKIEVGDFSVNPTKAYEALYNAPRNELISMLHRTARKWAFDPLRKIASSESPRMGFFPKGDGTSRLFALGVREYSNIETKTITLNFSGGFTFAMDGGKCSFKPFLPKELKLNSFDIFVAARHNGKWKGVRMIHKL